MGEVLSFFLLSSSFFISFFSFFFSYLHSHLSPL